MFNELSILFEVSSKFTALIATNQQPYLPQCLRQCQSQVTSRVFIILKYSVMKTSSQSHLQGETFAVSTVAANMKSLRNLNALFLQLICRMLHHFLLKSCSKVCTIFAGMYFLLMIYQTDKQTKKVKYQILSLFMFYLIWFTSIFSCEQTLHGEKIIT